MGMVATRGLCTVRNTCATLDVRLGAQGEVGVENEKRPMWKTKRACDVVAQSNGTVRVEECWK